MQEMSAFWLRAANVLYAVGLLHALWFLLRRQESLFRPAMFAFRLGVVLHGVALVERGMALRHIPADNFFETISLFAFLAAIAFLLVHWRYDFSSLSICVFPLVYLSTQVGTLEFGSAGWADSRVRDAWLLVHVLLILIGYAALFVTAVASVFYLLQERRLKLKVAGGPADRLPPLGTLDNIVTRSMTFGFVFITLGVVAGTTWAFFEKGTNWIGEPKIGISFFTWALCLLMIFLRANAGWRGRKAAVMSLTVLGSLALTWVAHVGLTGTLGR
jgi:ABC-type uncharacterized transport system permease subunit